MLLSGFGAAARYLAQCCARQIAMFSPLPVAAAGCRSSTAARSTAAVAHPAVISPRHPSRQGVHNHQQHRCLAAAAAAAGRQARGDRYSSIFPQPASSGSGRGGSRRPGSQQFPTSTPGSSSSSAGGIAAPVEPSVVASRQWLLRLLPVQQFRAVGVSFEDRQQLIPLLHRDQAVACVREPDNPHDPHAVAIRTLDGRSLGYIARDKTAFFLQDLCFGAVGSVGQQGTDGLWGFNVLVQPTIPPVEVQAFPANLAPHISLGMQLGGERWQQLKAATLAAAQGRCEVTGALLAAVHERWQFDDERLLLRLVGFRAEAPEVQQVGGLLQLEGQAAEAATALLQQLNCWSAADTEMYLSHVRQLQQQRTAQDGWRLDLSLLRQQGVPVPPALEQLCVP